MSTGFLKYFSSPKYYWVKIIKKPSKIIEGFK